MSDGIKTIATLRAMLEVTEENISDATKVLESTDEFETLTNLKAHKAAVKKKLDELTEQCKAFYVQNFDGENKRPHPAIGIQEKTVVEYDEQDMKEWAVSKGHTELLNLNKSAANKVAKGPLCPEFVETKKVITATIASDLSEYVE